MEPQHTQQSGGQLLFVMVDVSSGMSCKWDIVLGGCLLRICEGHSTWIY